MFSSLAIQVSSRLEINKEKEDHFKSAQLIEIRTQHSELTHNNF